MPVRSMVLETERLVESRRLLEAHARLMDLERWQDDILWQLHGAAGTRGSALSAEDEELVTKYFSGVGRLVEALGKETRCLLTLCRLGDVSSALQFILRSLNSFDVNQLPRRTGFGKIGRHLVSRTLSVAGKEVWAVVSSALALARQNPTPFVSAVRIVEREEALDRALLEDRGGAGASSRPLPPGRPRCWRARFFQVSMNFLL